MKKKLLLIFITICLSILVFDEFYKKNSAEPMIELIPDYVIERIEQYLEILK